MYFRFLLAKLQKNNKKGAIFRRKSHLSCLLLIFALFGLYDGCLDFVELTMIVIISVTLTLSSLQ